MRTFILSALALGALTTAAVAGEPITLTDNQMDKVTAGSEISSATRGFVVSSTFKRKRRLTPTLWVG
jgi:hypothetical protein